MEKQSREYPRVAIDLNIGIDALAFLDDNPLEREEVAVLLPEVHVIDLPAGPAHFAAALRSTPVFERLALSQEDCDGGTYYLAEQQRSQLQGSGVALDDYYRSLGMEVEISAVTSRDDRPVEPAEAHAEDQSIQPDDPPIQ